LPKRYFALFKPIIRFDNSPIAAYCIPTSQIVFQPYTMSDGGYFGLEY